MAERRMFTKKVTDDDVFTSMPPTAQCLYFHLCMGADDDGFSNNIRIAMFNAHASTDDFNTLVQKQFIIPFESGVIVIKHWKLHNYIRNDRYNETKYLEEKANLVLADNKVYQLSTNGIPAVYQMDTQVRIGKDSIDKIREDKVRIDRASSTKHKYGEYQHVLLTDKERERLVNDFGEDTTHEAIKYLDEYIEEKDYKSKSHNLAIRRWVIKAVQEKKGTNNHQSQLERIMNA